MDQYQFSRFAVRVKALHQFLDQLLRHAGPHLDPDRVVDTAEILHMGIFDLRRAESNPGQMGRKIVVACAVGHPAGQGLFIVEVQPLVAGEELDPIDLTVVAAAQDLHETERAREFVDHPLVLRCLGRVLHEVEIPVFGVMQVGKAAVRERPDEIEGHGRTAVATQQAHRVGDSCL